MRRHSSVSAFLEAAHECEDNLPDSLTCPLMCEMFSDPVLLTADPRTLGQGKLHTTHKVRQYNTYERVALKTMFGAKVVGTLIPNHVVKRACESWSAKALRQRRQTSSDLHELGMFVYQYGGAEASPDEEQVSVPDHLLDPVTRKALTTPYITKHGHTYSKRVLADMLRDNSEAALDPCAREEFSSKEIFPNNLVDKMLFDLTVAVPGSDSIEV